MLDPMEVQTSQGRGRGGLSRLWGHSWSSGKMVIHKPFSTYHRKVFQYFNNLSTVVELAEYL
jgi:hypothetical protein